MSLKSFIKKIIPISIFKFQKANKKQRELIKAQEKEIELLKKEQDRQFEIIEMQQDKIKKQLEELSEKSKRAYSLANLSYNYVAYNQKMEKHDYYRETPAKFYVQELSDWFFGATGEILELESPKTYDQKIQWLKIYDTTPLKTQLTDKYLVRDWVKEKIGEKYLTRLLGVWDSFDDIDFDALPDKFVLKANHGCAFNYIVSDKSKMNKSDARFKFYNWLKINYAYRWGMEPQYRDIQPKIIAEEYLENDDKDLYDYKFWCFNGKPEYIQFLSERNKGGLKMAFFDTEWNKMPFVYDHPRLDHEVEKPENLDEMLEIAKTLSQGFCHVRVDLYRLNDGTVKFGEMTFTSCSGTCHWDPPEYNEILGDLIKLPEKTNFFEEA